MKTFGTWGSDEGVVWVHLQKKGSGTTDIKPPNQEAHEKVQMLVDYLIQALWKQQWEETRSKIRTLANTSFYELFISASKRKVFVYLTPD